MALLDHLPPVRGRLLPGRPMADLSWLRTGGPAEVLFQPADAADLAAFLAGCPADVPVMVMGVGSNLIVRDGGIPGVVIRLGRAFAAIEAGEDGRVQAGAAALDAHVALRAAEAGTDLGFLRTIPGTIGGAVAMNAGCYGSYMADVLVSATGITRAGATVTLAREALGFGYRSAALPAGLVITAVTLRGPRDAPAAIRARMDRALAHRAATQPVEARSCGSTFRNPAGYSSTGRPDDSHELKAWTLIDRAGCRGLRLGGAAISEKHANFLVNAGGATAAELEALGEEVRRRVFTSTGIRLEWEIMRVGQALPAEPAAARGAEGSGDGA